MHTAQIIKTEFIPELSLDGRNRQNWSICIESLCYDDARNQMIVQRALLNLHDVTLILTYTSEHVEILTELLTARGVKVSKVTGYHGYRNVEEDVIVGTYSSVLYIDEIMFDIVLLTIPIKNRSYTGRYIGKNIQCIVDNNRTLSRNCNSLLESYKEYKQEKLKAVRVEDEWKFLSP